MTPETSTLRIAVVQPALQVGALDANLRHVEDLTRQAIREHAPDLVILPEAIGSPTAFTSDMERVVQPVTGAPYELLRRLARENGCWIGGGFHAARGSHARSTYVLTEPDGASHVHDKDQPELWEACIAAGSYDDGFASTPHGPIGLVCGLEWLRARTAVRLAGQVRLLVGGACWWSYPDWRLTRRWYGREHGRAIALAREAPARLARIVGAPAAVAHHVGALSSRTPLAPGLPYRTSMAGESQIVDRDGRVLARMSAGDGEGWIAADVRLAEPQILDTVPPGFWLTTLPASLHAAWLLQGLHGRIHYARRRRAGAFPWQGRVVEDLLPYNPPDLPPEQRRERAIVAGATETEPTPSRAPKATGERRSARSAAPAARS